MDVTTAAHLSSMMIHNGPGNFDSESSTCCLEDPHSIETASCETLSPGMFYSTMFTKFTLTLTFLFFTATVCIIVREKANCQFG